MIDASPGSKTQKRCVVILGAGASVPFGLPAMEGLLTRNMLNESPSNENLREERLRMLQEKTEFKKQLKEFAKEVGNTNVEEILTAALDDTVNYSVNDKPKFRKNIHLFLKCSLYDDVQVKRNQFLDPFFKYCEKEFAHTTWSSFNWDCTFESGFYYSFKTNPRPNPHLGIDLDITMRNFRTNTHPDHLFLKLHGGINWWWENSSLIFLETHSGNKQGCYVNHYWNKYRSERTPGEPAILDPISNKYDRGTEIYKKLIEPQWEKFESSLREADVIIIIGYSLPKTDGDKMNTILQNANPKSRMIVFDIDREVHTKYMEIPGWENRVGWLSKEGKGMEGVPYEEYKTYEQLKTAIDSELKKLPPLT